MKIMHFSFLAIFEFHVDYRVKKGQTPDQNLNHFTFYDRGIISHLMVKISLLYVINTRCYI